MSDFIKEALAQAMATTEPMSGSLDNDSATSNASEAQVDAPDAIEKMLNGESSESSESTDSKQDPSKDQKASNGEKETIVITDETGKRQKIEVDFSNREAVKKAFTQAAGMRKFQAERDKSIQAARDLEKKVTEREADWSKLEQLFEQGPEALFDALSGKQGSFNDHLKKQMERNEFLRNASPEEIKQLETQERADKQSRELDKIRSENEKFRKEMLGKKEEVEVASMQSLINPIFDKYRFAEKLGNPVNEQLFDEMLWNSTIKRLEPYEEKGLDLSRELIEREFKAVSQSLRSTIGKQADKKADRVIAQKKQEATENVQSKVMSGYKASGSNKEASDLIKKGDLSSIFKGWSKLGKSF